MCVEILSVNRGWSALMRNNCVEKKEWKYCSVMLAGVFRDAIWTENMTRLLYRARI